MCSTTILFKYGRSVVEQDKDYDRKKFRAMENAGLVDRMALVNALQKARIRPTIDHRYMLLVGMREVQLATAV